MGKVCNINESKDFYAKSEVPPPPDKLFKRVKRIKNLADAQKLLTESIAYFQKGLITSTESKTIAYLVQNFIAVYKSNLEEVEIYNHISLYLEEYITSRDIDIDYFMKEVQDRLGTDEWNRIDRKYKNLFSKLKSEKLEVKKQLIDELNKKSSLQIKLNSEEDPEVVVRLLINEFNKLPEKNKLNLIEMINERMNENN